MGRTIAVCVPVRNEASRLPRLLDALARQDGPAFTLSLLLDGCSDASAAVIAGKAPAMPFRIAIRDIAGGPPSAGRARRAAMALGTETVGVDGILLSTDADSVPAADWIAANLAALAQADVVAGRIVRRGAPVPVQDRIERYYDMLFACRRRIDPVPWEAPVTHHYASGASLAFRASAYRAVGGFEGVAAGEDGRIVDAAHRAGLRVRRDAAVLVETSGRRHGRARGGLADHLAALDAASLPLVAHPFDEAWRWRAQATARAAFGGDLNTFARSIGRDAHDVAGVAAAVPSAEAFATLVVPEVSGGTRAVPLDIAEALLRGLDGERQAA